MKDNCKQFFISFKQGAHHAQGYLEQSGHRRSTWRSDTPRGRERPLSGEASYYNVVVDGKVNENAAWYYPEPSAMAARIKDYIAFWRGIQVEE
jgi:uncharacterized protein (DUF427 family)